MALQGAKYEAPVLFVVAVERVVALVAGVAARVVAVVVEPVVAFAVLAVGVAAHAVAVVEPVVAAFAVLAAGVAVVVPVADGLVVVVALPALVAAFAVGVADPALAGAVALLVLVAGAAHHELAAAVGASVAVPAGVALQTAGRVVVVAVRGFALAGLVVVGVVVVFAAFAAAIGRAVAGLLPADGRGCCFAVGAVAQPVVAAAPAGFEFVGVAAPGLVVFPAGAVDRFVVADRAAAALAGVTGGLLVAD